MYTPKKYEEAQRLHAPAWRLLGGALGGPGHWAGRFRRAVETVDLAFDRDGFERRFDELERRGLAPARASRLQVVAGGFDMLRHLITPAAGAYYEAIGIDFTFHQVLRILDDPVSMIDASGFFSTFETIAGHLMQVVHLNPIFDVQLVQMFPGGLARLEDEVRAMVAGRHPRQRTIGAIIEDPGYHERLLDYLVAYRQDPDAPPPVRDAGALRESRTFTRIERAFATLPGFVAYCGALPRNYAGTLRHLQRGVLDEAGLERAILAAAERRTPLHA